MVRALPIAMCLLLAAPLASAQRREHRIDLDASGTVAVSDLVDLGLRHLGSRVQLPAGVGGRIAITGWQGLATLAGITAALGDVGIIATIDTAGGGHGQLVIRIDRDRWLAGLDGAEARLRDWLGAPARYDLLPAPERTPGGPVVVLIHGLDSCAENLLDAANALGRRGYDVRLFAYPDDGRITHTAQRLGERLRAIRQSTGQVVHLVTTSMGGVIARTYVELSADYGGEVATLIACNPPYQGSWMANYHELWEIAETTVDFIARGFAGSPVHDGLGQASTELLPGSELMRRLQAARRRPGVRYAILAGAKPVADPALLTAATELVESARATTSDPWAHLLLDLTSELITTARHHGNGGDGAVRLERQWLAGVTDRVVRDDVHHLEALSRRKNGKGVHEIVWLDEVLARLPAP